jgi:hypothetical protein
MHQPGHNQYQNKAPDVKGSRDLRGEPNMFVAHYLWTQWIPARLFLTCDGLHDCDVVVNAMVVNDIAANEGGQP